MAHASAGDDVQTWRALDRAEAAVGRVAAQEPPPWPWVFPFDARKMTAESHMAASDLMISMVSELLAVWDGKPARGYGGTADVVTHAFDRGRRVRVIWPEDATRD